MSAKQKLQDGIDLVKGNRKTQIVGLVLVFMALFLVFNDGGKKRRKKKQQAAPKVGTISENEYSDDIIRAFQENQARNTETLEKLREANERTQKQLEDNEERVSVIIKKMLEKLDRTTEAQVGDSGRASDYEPVPLPALGNPGAQVQPQTIGLNPAMNQFALTEDPALEQIFPDEPLPLQPPAPPEPEKVAFVGAGDSVRIKLIGGVNAPTNGSPEPVIFKIIGDITGPDGTTLPIGEARLIAAAQGSLVDSRVVYRLTRLSIRFPNTGERKVVNVDGWVVGEDGIRGMQGILVDPLGKVLAGQFVTGAIDGVGQGLAQSQQQIFRDLQNNPGQQTEVIDGDIGVFALGRGASGAARGLSTLLRDRLSKLEPKVKAYSGREATAVFSDSFSIPGLYEALNSMEEDFF